MPPLAADRGFTPGGSDWRILGPPFPLGAFAQGLPPLSLAMARFTPQGGSNWRIPPPLDP